MTTRIAALTVILDGKPPREDDIEDLIACIRRLRGVADVVAIEHSSDMVVAEMRAKIEIRKQLFAAYEKIFSP